MSTPRLPLDEEATALRLARSTAGRLDKLEPSVKDVQRQVRKLGEGLAVVLRSKEEEESEGQPDWLTCRDPDKAVGILTDTTNWLDECGSYHGVNPVACWPWHPPVVALLLSTAQHYRAAYSGDATRVVLDLLTQYIPTVRARVSGGRADDNDLCNANQHSIGKGGPAYGYDVTRLDAMAIWWATDRTGLAPGLRPTD